MNHRAHPQCSGACDQGRRNCGCTTGHVIDRLPEDFDKPEPVTGREAVALWIGLLTPGTVALCVASFYYLASHGYL